MNIEQEQKRARLHMTRRELFGLTGRGIGVAALASLLSPARVLGEIPTNGGLPGLPHFAPRAKRVIFLFQVGAPSQMELFDYKPNLKKLHKTLVPDSVINKGGPLVGMMDCQVKQSAYVVAAPMFEFKQAGQSGTWISELLPHTAKIVDEIAIIRSVRSDVVEHGGAATFLLTGVPIAGRPSMGAWVSYGLGSENQNLPTYVVLTSKGYAIAGDQPAAPRYWTAGFMPSRYQGVPFRASSDAVVYLSNPPGLTRTFQRRILNDLTELNQGSYETYGDPEIQTRIAQYEMAYRMQASVPELTDLSKEPDSVFDLYGPDARKPGSYAANCILARRLAERGVRFIQLFQRGWDQHTNLPSDIQLQCKGTDQPTAALIQDLKQRGLLEDTLVVWAGEFGRTIYSQGEISSDNYGRDHHGRCFTAWMAGGGVKPGISYGETDDFSYNVASDAVSVHDLQATILHCLGIDHTRLIYRFQGRDFRLTDVAGDVVRKILV